MEQALAEVRHLLEEKRTRNNTSSKNDDDGDLHHHESLLKLADAQYPDRIRDSNFLLMFLRADDFDAVKAVDRIMLHLTEQQMLFGGLFKKRVLTPNFQIRTFRLFYINFLICIFL